MFSDPTFWFLVAFVIFVSGISKHVWKFVREFLDQHGIKIEEKIKDAIRMREEAQTLLGEVRKKQMQAQEHANDIIEHARLQAEEMRKEAQAELDHFLKTRERLAHDRIEHAQNQATNDIRNQTILLSTEACQKILKKGLSDEKHAELIDQAIIDLEANGTKNDWQIT